MGWQGWSSGDAFSSQSGDALLVGSLTQKPVDWCVMSRTCSICKGWKWGWKKTEVGVDKDGRRRWKRNPVPQDSVPDHKCQKNWEGLPGSMEPVAILAMVVLPCDEY